MHGLLRKMRKVRKLAGNPTFRRGLTKRVAASIEHVDMVNRHPFETLIDIGANRGQFSLLARGLFPKAQIHAFEPLSSARETYLSVFGDDPLTKLHPIAAGSARSEEQINITAKNDSSSLMALTGVQTVFSEHGTHQVGQETVTVDRLDVVLKDEELRGPVFCKIDVQGFELEAIKGCEGILDKIDVFYVECNMIELYGGQPKTIEIINHLAERGFHMNRIGHVSGVPKEPGVAADILFSKG